MSRPLRRRDSGHTRDAALGPSMTPMVDVTLVILIFFMASTAFVGPEWLLRTALPQPPGTQQAVAPGATAFTLPPARFDLSISTDSSGATIITGLGLNAAPLADACRQIAAYATRLGPDRLSIFIDPDATVPYRDVVRLHEACAEAGIESVGLK